MTMDGVGHVIDVMVALYHAYTMGIKGHLANVCVIQSYCVNKSENVREMICI